MEYETVNLAHQYIAILRCRTWCEWPEWQRFVSSAYRDPVRSESGVAIYLSVHIHTYKERQRPEGSPAIRLSNHAGPLLWRGAMTNGYWLGDMYIKAPEDTSRVEMEYEPPYEGEIDLQLHMGTQQEIPIDQLTAIARTICDSALAFVNLAASDLMVPVAPLQIRRLIEEGSQIQTATKVGVRRRVKVPQNAAAGWVLQFAEVRGDLNSERAQALSVAARRFTSALAESDSVDRYCDFWETCEFATLHERAAKGGVVGRIAQALTSHLNTQHPHLTKRTTENALALRSLHRTRGRIIHEASDSPRDLEDSMRLLEAIAAELLRYNFRLPYTTNDRIERRLRDSRTTPPLAANDHAALNQYSAEHVRDHVLNDRPDKNSDTNTQSPEHDEPS